MENHNFNQLLLKTGFSCMACDGHIDDREVELIKSLSKEKNFFGDLDTSTELQKLIENINDHGHGFLRQYLKELDDAHLNEEEELKVIKVAIDVIEADKEVEYSEIKFFKIIRTHLDISDENVLKSYPEFEEYLEKDVISDSYYISLQNDFFENYKTPQFESLKIDENL
ncbi:hypothetical protein ACKGJN_11300 [Gillisia sp. Q332]|uniref:hypothetical protein n=1 Tax=Gillisia xinjiangensis TaxID=3384765 RepID=UPI003918F613